MSNFHVENEPRQRRMEPPLDLPLAQRDIWCEVVNSVPDWHLTKQHEDLVRRYVHAVWLHRKFLSREAERVEKEGLTSMFSNDGTEVDNLEYYLSKRGKEIGNEIANLASALKLTPIKPEAKESRKKGIEDAEKTLIDKAEKDGFKGSDLLYGSPL